MQVNRRRCPKPWSRTCPAFWMRPGDTTNRTRSPVCCTLDRVIFFQHIEGSEADIEALYQQLLRDPRHQHLQVLARGPLEQRHFAGWSMKYVALNPALQDWPHFNPYQLQGEGLAQFLLNLQQMHGILPTTPAAPPKAPTSAPAAQPLQPRERWMGMVGILMMALLLVLAFFWVRQQG